MNLMPYNVVSIEVTRIGIVVLQSDETIERDMMPKRGNLWQGILKPQRRSFPKPCA